MLKIDMDMPKCCADCPVLNDDGDYPMCRITQTSRGYDFPKLEKRMDDCPLKDEGYEPIRNAKIIDTRLTMESHGCLTFFLTLQGDGWGVNFGGYSIAHGYLNAKTFEAEDGHGLEAIMRIMDVVGVDRWEDLKGKDIRAKSTWRNGAPVDVIGNLIEDKWFNIREFFAKPNKEGK